ncbi:MAG: sulfatase-like hydrolase/transferase [Acidobacteria bacterium]|nr:sulfatase-like hydrolase/transferase [Acidobacteriota bacterium]
MQRREFIGSAALAPAAGAARYINRKEGSHPFRVRQTGARPHVFLICLDMVSPDQFLPSRELQREMELPALRGLMAGGVNFANAFCTISICAPSRASMYTGRHPYVLANPGGGLSGMESILRSGDVIFPEYLKATGYRTKHAGKNHVGAQKFMDAFDELDSNWNAAMPQIERDEGYRAYLRRAGIKMPRYAREIFTLRPDRKTRLSQNYGGWIEQSDGKPFPLEGQYSYYLAQWAEQKLDDALALGGGQAPVYLQLNIYDPHKPFTIPDGFQKREEHLRRAIALPPSFQQAAARDFRPAPGDPPLLDTFRKFWGFYQPETARDFMVGNALAMEMADRAVGRFLQALKQRGLYDDSLIILTADHGEMNCHLGLVDKGCYIHPETQRVPLVVKPPASYGVRNRTVEEPVSLLDIAATVCDVTGVEPLERMDGVSLVPVLKGGAPQAGRALMFQAGWQITGNPACGTQRWEPGGRHHMFVHNVASATDELYDMHDPDPQNLAHKPEHQAVRKEMAERLFALIRTDPRVGPYSAAFQMHHYSNLTL